MPLNHVSMWTDAGFQPTTPEAAKQRFPNGANVHSGLFYCRMCDQQVTFTKTHYFKHSRGEDDKSCPERTFGAGGSEDWLYMRRSLPVRLTVHSAQSFSLEIGIALPADINIPPGEICITASRSNDSFQFHTQRLLLGDITYLSVAQNIAQHYLIGLSCADKGTLRAWIPSEIDGIPSDGCMFHVYQGRNSGKMLPQGAAVQVQQEYFLLTPKSLEYDLFLDKDIVCERKCRCRIRHNEWYIYYIKANSFHKAAAEFFLEYRYILTGATASLIPVWPVYKTSPYVTYHNASELWMFFNGQDVSAQIYPNYNIIHQFDCDSGHENAVAKISCTTRQQTVLTGKSKVLRYRYLQREPLHTHTKLPAVFITDVDGTEITEETARTLPKQRLLRIQAPFDGKVLIRKNGRLTEKRSLKAKQTTELDQISYGMEIQVLQGLDTVWRVCFQTPETHPSANDEQLYKQLCMCRGRLIPFPHRYGASVSYCLLCCTGGI